MEMTWSFISELWSLVIAVAATGCASRYGQVEPNLQSMAHYGVSYVSGGDSEAGMDAMLAIANRFNVRLTMVAASGRGPATGCCHPRGQPGWALDIACDRNRADALSPASHGVYRLAVGYQGWVQTRDIAVDDQALDMTFRLPVTTLGDDWLLCSKDRGHVAVTAAL